MRRIAVLATLPLLMALGCSHPLQHIQEDRLDGDHSSLLGIGIQVENRTPFGAVDSVEFRIVKLGAGGATSRCANGNAWAARWPLVVNERANGRELVGALFQQAQPGRYRLEEIVVNLARPNDHSRVYTAVKIRREFEVHAGRALYLGKIKAILQADSMVGQATAKVEATQSEDAYAEAWSSLQKSRPSLAAQFGGAVDRPAWR